MTGATMSSKVDRRMKRWQEQRWILDAVIQTIGVEWDQARLAYMSAPGGPEAVAEFRRVGATIKKTADIDRAFVAAAKRRQARAEEYEKQGRGVSAGEQYFIAQLLWATARWPIFEANKALLDMEEQMNHCFAKYIEYAKHPITRVEVPFGNKAMPAYLHLPHKPAPGEKFPCVLYIDGMDGCKEMMVSAYGDPHLERGIAVLAIDGPGQGECCTIPIPVTPRNHGDAAVAAVDFLAARPEIDAARIAVRGVSMGTYFTPCAAAALGDRIKGVAMMAVCQEPGFNMIFNMASPTFKLRYMFMTGIEDEDEFDEYAKQFELFSIADKIKCPYLCLAGEDDQLSPIEYSYELFDKIKAPKKLVVYEGAEHGIMGAPSAGLGENPMVMIIDWLEDRLKGKPMKSEKVFIDGVGRATVTPV
jgi:dienelactone hydrolase